MTKHIDIKLFLYFFIKSKSYSLSVPLQATHKSCPVGRYCPEQSGTPKLCPAGTFRTDELGQELDDCTPCTAGQSVFFI